MPIDKREFDFASQPLPEKILQVLNSNRDKAFTLFEIICRVENRTPKDTIENVFIMLTYGEKYNEALGQLLTEGKINVGEIRGDTYYGIL